MEELELIQRCRTGDYIAFEALYELHARKALRTAYLIAHSRAAAEDAVQEAFVQVWLRIGSLREPAAFRAWFYRIVFNTAYRISKNHRRVAFVSLDLQEHDKLDHHTLMPEERAEMNEDLAELRAAVASLPEIHRLPLVLRYYTGLMEAEIAQVLGIPVGTVKSRLYSARRALHRALSTTSSADLRP